MFNGLSFPLKPVDQIQGYGWVFSDADLSRGKGSPETLRNQGEQVRVLRESGIYF